MAAIQKITPFLWFGPRHLPRRPLLSLLLAAGVLTAACGDDDGTGPEAEARVRVVHAAPDAPDVDILVDDAEVLDDVPYLGVSEYLDVEAGARNLKVNAAGTTTTLIDADETLAEGADYTFIAGGLVGAVEGFVLEDDNTTPAAGIVRVRAMHGAPSAPAVDIYVTSPGEDLPDALPALGNMEFGDVTGYIEAPAGEYQVRVTLAGTQTVVIDSGPFTLASGQVRTVIAVDATGGGAPFALLLLEDLN